MAQNVGGVILDTALLDKLTAEMKPKAAQIVNEWGLKIMTEAAANAPVDTGALRNSITSESNMEGEMTFIVQDGVEYGIFQELGTSKMAAHPFLVPAMEHNAKDFENAFAELFK